MPDITSARVRARDATPFSENHPDEPSSGTGWCLRCYDEGAFTLAADALGTTCAIHARDEALSGPVTAGEARPGPNRSGGAGSRPGAPLSGGSRGPGRRPSLAERRDTARRAKARAKAREYGLRRAAKRVDEGRYEPHPGMQNFLPPGRIVDQAAALRAVEQLVAAQPWRSDRRDAWLAILCQLVRCMDWETGLVAAVTAERLGGAGGRAARTVSRVMSWAVAAGLVVVAEKAAAPDFLGSKSGRGRTPTYALYRPPGLSEPPAASEPLPDPDLDDSPPLADAASADINAQVNDTDGEIGDLPGSSVRSKPLIGKRLERTTPVTTSWPTYRVPQTASERTFAAKLLLRRLGLDGPGVSGGVLSGARMLLKIWWDAGACPAGLLWAIDHHPDRPDHRRGDALRGARDPLDVLGHRLQPWLGRLGELPLKYVGHRGDYVAAAAAQIETKVAAAAEQRRAAATTTFTPTTSEETRAAHRAQFAAERDRQRNARRGIIATTATSETCRTRTNTPGTTGTTGQAATNAHSARPTSS